MAEDKSIHVLLERIMSDVAEEENEILFNCMSKAMKKAKQDLKNTSPRRTGEYARGWTIRTKRHRSSKSIEGVVYNNTKPGLTFLLENGHVIRNAKGEYGRTGKHPHIQEARDNAEEYLIELLTEAHE